MISYTADMPTNQCL